jgi:hypothetical protein
MSVIEKVSHWLKPQQLINESSAVWILECFAYALKHLDSEEFIQRTKLIKPTNNFFPGSVGSVEEKAENIFAHSMQYAGVAHWPFKLIHPTKAHSLDTLQEKPYDEYALTVARDSKREDVKADFSKGSIFLSYNPQQTLKPEDLASSFSQLFAQHLIFQSRQLPPGGEQYMVEASEVVAVFMGFGVMLSNSAYTFRGGCGSCFNAASNRQANLSEDEIVFALAAFCRLKGIGNKEGSQYLKKHLKGSFTTATRQFDALVQGQPALLKMTDPYLT